MVAVTNFLQYADEEIANIEVGRLSQTKVEEANKANDEVSQLNVEETILGVGEVANQETDADNAQDISYQPFNEGLYSVSGTSMPAVAISSLVNNNLAIHKENENSVAATTDVDPTQIEVNGVINQENAQAGKVIATAAVASASLAEKGKGGVHLAADTNLNLYGRNVTTSTQGVHTVITPVLSNVATTIQQQSNQYLHTANLISERSNVAFYNFTDGKTEVSGSNFTAVRENATTVGKNLVSKAVEQLENTASTIVSNAGDRNIIASQRVIAIDSQREIGMQAGDVAITAASSNILEESAAAASAGSIARDIVTSSKGNVFIAGVHPDPVTGGNVVTTGNFIDTSSKTDTIISSNLGFYNGATFKQEEFIVAATISDTAINYTKKLKIDTDGRGSHIQFNGRNYFGRTPFIPKETPDGVLRNARSIIDLPAKTKLPGGVTKGQLDNCIPNKFKVRKEDEEGETEATTEADTGVTPTKTDVTSDNPSAVPMGAINFASIQKADQEELTNLADSLRNDTSLIPPGLGATEGTITDQELTSRILGPNAIGFPNVHIPLQDLIDSLENPFDPDREDGDSKDGNIGGTNEDTTTNAVAIDLQTAAFNYISGQTIQDAADEVNVTNFAAILELKSNLNGTAQFVLASIRVVNQEITEQENQQIIRASGINTSIEGVLEIITVLITKVEESVSSGGIITSARGVFNDVSATVNLVTNEVTDVIQTVNDVVQPVTQIYNGVRGLPVVGNLGIWNVLDPIVSNTSATFNQLFRASRALTRNPNGTFTELLSKFMLRILEQRINRALQQAGINLTVEQLDKIKDFLFKVARTNLGSANRDNRTLQRERAFVISGIQQIVGDELLAFTVYTSLESLIRLIENGNVENLVSREVITSLVGYVIGPASMAIIRDVANVYVTGRRLYQAVLAAPSLLKLMNEYKMPPLARVTTLLGCLDLLNRVGNVIQAIANLVNRFDGRGNQTRDNTIPGSGGDETLNDLIDVDTTGVAEPPEGTEDIYTPDQHTPNKLPGRYFTNYPEDQDPDLLIDITEDNCQFIVDPAIDTTTFLPELPSNEEILDTVSDLPRLYQILNSVQEYPTDSVAEIENNLFTPAEIESLRTVRPLVEDDAQCFVAPKLNFLEATVVIREIHKAALLFEVPALSLLKYNNKDVRPTAGNTVNIKVSGFINNKNGKTYTPSKDREFYSPSTYTFQITEFKEQENIGLAVLIPLQTTIYLQDSEQITYSYDVMDIGKRLTPMIVDAYLTI